MIIVLLVTIWGFEPAYEFICHGGDGNCARAREWISALSGWAAAVAAFATIRILVSQLNAQRQQTDFQLGDAAPSIDAVQHINRNRKVQIRITNWNRRPMIIRSIEADVDGLIFYVVRAGIENLENVQKNGNVITFQPALLVPGWVDRSKAPHIEKIDLEEISAGSHAIHFQDTEFSLKFELAGKKQLFTERVELHMTVEELHE